MRRLIPGLLALGLVISACSAPDGGNPTTVVGDPAASTSAASGTPPTSGTATTDGSGTTTSSVAPSSQTTSDRPLALDFTLALGDGGSYTLSEGAKPVYLVFWAEW